MLFEKTSLLEFFMSPLIIKLLKFTTIFSFCWWSLLSVVHCFYFLLYSFHQNPFVKFLIAEFHTSSHIFVVVAHFFGFSHFSLRHNPTFILFVFYTYIVGIGTSPRDIFCGANKFIILSLSILLFFCCCDT